MSGPRNWMSAADAAQELGLSAPVVRKHLADGALPGQRVGRQWLVDADAVAAFGRSHRQPGRPFSPAIAWAVLLAASGDREGARLAAREERPYYRALQWLRAHSLADEAARVRGRARPERFDVHPSELRRLASREDVVRSGVSAAERVGLVGGAEEVEVYLPASARRSFIDGHGAEPGDGPVLVRWIADELWPLLDRGGDSVAPSAAVYVDLLESDDPRARREARAALESVGG